MRPKLIVHGGAWDIPDEHVDNHVAGVRTAVETIFSMKKSPLCMAFAEDDGTIKAEIRK